MKKKTKYLIIMGFIFPSLMVFPSLSNYLLYEPMRNDLQQFYKISLDNSVIQTVSSVSYIANDPEERQLVFKVRDRASFYPIVLKKMSRRDLQLIRTGAVVSKKKDSANLRISTDGITSDVLHFKHYMLVGLNEGLIFVSVLFFGLLYVLALSLPNNFYEKEKKVSETKKYTTGNWNR